MCSPDNRNLRFSAGLICEFSHSAVTETQCTALGRRGDRICSWATRYSCILMYPPWDLFSPKWRREQTLSLCAQSAGLASRAEYGGTISVHHFRNVRLQRRLNTSMKVQCQTINVWNVISLSACYFGLSAAVEERRCHAPVQQE